MRRATHYRRFHHLYLDIVVVFAIAGLGWWVWPSGPSTRGGGPLPAPSVAYGDVDPRTVGSLLYPGHFAFASPIGFGATPRRASDTRWSVGTMLPFTPSLARAVLPEPSPATLRPELPPVPARCWNATDAPTSAGVRYREFLDVEPDAALRSRGFAMPPFSVREIVGTNVPSGEVRAHVRLDEVGQVEHVVFPPGSGMTWVGLRPFEDVILRARAARGSSTGGWVRIRWQSVAGAP